ncbi:response regulator [Desulfatirhabdium butyrativorans]|uniref:response regulator n=1 Tax=Desulfatirhabdium butyrativorans TaxID=340467 RepID=UPI0003FB458F|nr:response regulator [Desulfatirhabdium butyrativorans]
MAIATIMLVDDEVPFVETMTKRLTRREFDVQTAYSGEACMATLEKDRSIEVVILDVKMPGMDGIETLQQIKSKHPLVEVIMLTGHATVESAIDGMKLGAFDYLMKPCDMDQLIAKVTQAAQRKRDQEERIVQARVQAITTRQA